MHLDMPAEAVGFAVSITTSVHSLVLRRLSADRCQGQQTCHLACPHHKEDEPEYLGYIQYPIRVPIWYMDHIPF